MSTANELLARALEELNWLESPTIVGEIRTFLAAEPEAEPVAYLFDADSYCDHAPIKDELVQSLPKGILRQKIKNVRPLYTRPEPARKPKPMSEEEIDEELETNEYYCAKSFADGVRWAELHHGIGSNKSDPDSIDLQSRCRGDKL